VVKKRALGPVTRSLWICGPRKLLRQTAPMAAGVFFNMAGIRVPACSVLRVFLS
jgi:hypothetical protein